MINARPGIQAQGVANRRDGWAVLSHLVGKHAQQMVGVGVIGIRLQDLAVQALGLRQIARLMIMQGLGECFRNGGHGN